MVNATIIAKPLCPKFPLEQYLNREITLEEMGIIFRHRIDCKFCQRLPKEIQADLSQAEIDALVKAQDGVRPKVQKMEADGTLDQWCIDNKLDLMDIFGFESSFGVRIGDGVKNRFLPKPKLRLV